MPTPRAKTERVWLALLLGWVGGYVDAVGFIALAHLFTAHMSGNSVGMGAYLGQGDWHEAARRATPIPFFVVGIAGGVALIEVARRAGVRAAMSVALALEAALLLAFRLYGAAYLRAQEIGAGAWRFTLLVALLALAMGIQTAALQRVGRWSVRTTYITGMLTDLAQETVSYLFWLRDRDRDRYGAPDANGDQLVREPPSLGRTLLLAGVWGIYIVGAVAGGLAMQRWDLNALALPLLALAAIIAVDVTRPIYAPED